MRPSELLPWGRFACLGMITHELKHLFSCDPGGVPCSASFPSVACWGPSHKWPDESASDTSLVCQPLQTNGSGKSAPMGAPSWLAFQDVSSSVSCPSADTLSTTYDSMCCARPEKPPKAAAASKGGKGRGGKQA